MTVDHMVVEPHKRGRGRPRKHPVCLPSPELQSGVVQPEKRKRGCPRLSERDSPASSTLPEQPEEEKEREGEEEMGGEDLLGPEHYYLYN